MAEVAPLGGFTQTYQVNVDPNRLRAYGMPISRVVDAVRAGNVEVGGRLVELGGSEYMVRGRGYARSVRDIEDIVLSASESGIPIRIKDVGHVVLGPDLRRGVSDLDGAGEVVTGIVVMRQGENALDVIDRVKARIREIEPGLPKGVKIVPVYDRSDLIRRAIGTLKTTILEVILTDLDRHPALPVARAERPHPGGHHPAGGAHLLRPLRRDGPHRQHHVARGDRDRHRRPRRRGDRGGGADPQAAGAVGAAAAARATTG